jgi:hypothetical protein
MGITFSCDKWGKPIAVNEVRCAVLVQCRKCDATLVVFQRPYRIRMQVPL